jgi:hypothetical protein
MAMRNRAGSALYNPGILCHRPLEVSMRRLLPVLTLAVGVLAFCAVLRAQQASRMDPTHNTTTADVPGLTAATSVCGTSEDATYGTTETNAIKVGGGDAYLASREVKYLSALRGPTGQGLHFVRTGSLRGESDHTILDAYTVDYPGLEKARVLYLDGYHWDQPLAPKGWLCGAAMNLNPPGPDPFATTRKLAQLAIDHREAYADPISLDPDGLHAHGVVFDFPRLVGASARDAAAHGAVFDADHLPAALRRQHTVIVASPSDCAGQPGKVVDIALADARGNQAPVSSKANSPKDIAALTSGYVAPDGSMAVVYDVVGLIAGATVTVRYDVCGEAPSALAFAAKSAPPRVVTSVVGTAPAGATVRATGETVGLQLFVLPDGSPQLPEYANGAYEFRDAALAAIKQWTFTPFLINGAPILRAETVTVLVK